MDDEDDDLESKNNANKKDGAQPGEGSKKPKKQSKDHIEISCPIFLRPLMRQILSVGKSIKIVRFLENENILYAHKPRKQQKKLKEAAEDDDKAEITKNVGRI